MPSVTYTHIKTQLSPYLGEKMAQAILHAHCQSLGMSAEELSMANAGALVGRLEVALKAFVGSSRAAALVKAIMNPW